MGFQKKKSANNMLSVFIAFSLPEVVARRKVIRWCSDGNIISSDMAHAHIDANFLEDIVLILLRSRQILSSSYALGFFIMDEHHQGLEELQVTDAPKSCSQ